MSLEIPLRSWSPRAPSRRWSQTLLPDPHCLSPLERVISDGWTPRPWSESPEDQSTSPQPLEVTPVRREGKEDVICHLGKWTTMERGIQYLREGAVLEVIDDLDNEQLSKDADEVQCTRPMWWKFERSAPSSHANSLAVMTWKDGEEQMVDELAGQLRNMKKVSLPPYGPEFQQLKEGMSYSPPVWTSISAVKSKHPSAQERGHRGYTPWGTLWFYLRDHGEDMRKWDGKSTSTLEARARELQGKTITKGGSSRKIAAPVSSEQFLRQSRRADLTSDLNKGNFYLHLQEVGNEYYDQD
ncbi:hypothetical protein QYF61_004938 [Mycteria americana]|uniref:Uncharacterized protein n=1 Tax=Mycteria americana TaxID=33587 RepID=A0AAN7NC42_MYCAM|nr:hypothetical protein QYF61_004938 [Mycteria americana]